LTQNLIVLAQAASRPSLNSLPFARFARNPPNGKGVINMLDGSP